MKSSTKAGFHISSDQIIVKSKIAKASTRKLAFLDDRVLKNLVNRFGFAGAAREINKKYRIYRISVTKQTIRNECRRRGIRVSAHDIKDGLFNEFKDFVCCKYLKLENVEHIGLKIGDGVDIYCEHNGEKIWIESRNWNLDRKIDKKLADERIIKRFKGKEGRKILIHSKNVEFTDAAKKLLEDEDVEYVGVGNEKLTRKNFDRMVIKTISKLGLLLGLPLRVIYAALRKAKQESKEHMKYWGLIENFVELGAIKVCNVDTDFDEIDESEDDGGGGYFGSLIIKGGGVMSIVKSKLSEVEKKLDEINQILKKFVKLLKSEINTIEIKDAARELESKAREMRRVVRRIERAENEEKKIKEVIKGKVLLEKINDTKFNDLRQKIDIVGVLDGNVNPFDIEKAREVYLAKKRAEHENKVSNDLAKIKEKMKKETERIRAGKDTIFFSETAKETYEKERGRIGNLGKIKMFVLR